MRSIQKIRRLFWFAVVFIFLMSASILLMPIAVRMGEQDRKMTALIGIVFWLSAITGYTLIAMANTERKWFIIRKVDGDVKMNCHPGIATFFTNVPATVFDVTMILSFLMLIIINFTDWRYEYVTYVLLFLMVLSLNMHCLFNGRIYKATKYKRTRRESSYE